MKPACQDKNTDSPTSTCAVVAVDIHHTASQCLHSEWTSHDRNPEPSPHLVKLAATTMKLQRGRPRGRRGGCTGQGCQTAEGGKGTGTWCFGFSSRGTAKLVPIPVTRDVFDTSGKREFCSVSMPILAALHLRPSRNPILIYKTYYILLAAGWYH